MKTSQEYMPQTCPTLSRLVSAAEMKLLGILHRCSVKTQLAAEDVIIDLEQQIKLNITYKFRAALDLAIAQANAEIRAEQGRVQKDLLELDEFRRLFGNVENAERLIRKMKFTWVKEDIQIEQR